MFKTLKILILSFLMVGLFACNQEKNAGQRIRVGTIVGPETALMEAAQYVAKDRYNLDIEIVQFQDYATPNAALADGTLDANAFQTVQYLEQAKANKGYDFVIVGNTFIYPMGLYSQQIKNITEFPAGSEVAIPNDPSNEERALLLLEKAGLIKLDHSNKPITTQNIQDNPLNLRIIPLDAAQLPRSSEDLVLTAINTNFAVEAGLYPSKDALVAEGSDSPYVNVIVTRKVLQNDPRIAQLVAAYQSEEVLAKAKQLFQGQAIPGWVETYEK